MISAEVNENAPVVYTAPDGAISKGVRAFISTVSGVPVATVNLTHQSGGTYVGTFSSATPGFFIARFFVYTDNTYTTEDLLYARISEEFRITLSPTSPTGIASAVWDELAQPHTVAGSFAMLLKSLSANFTPSGIASAVWDELVAGHSIPNTFGDYIQVIRQSGFANTGSLTDPTFGLAALHADITNALNTLISEANQNEVKIDAIIPAITSAKNALTAEIDQNEVKIDAVIPAINAAKTQIISEIDQNETRLISLAAQVSAIQNNTTIVFTVPERLVKPASGNKTYEFHLRLYDETGMPEAPDSAPTVLIRRIDTGADVVNGAAMTPFGVVPGAYVYSHTISAGTDEYPMLVEATVVEGGVTRTAPRVSEITEFESDLNQIQSQLTAVQGDVTTTKNFVSSGVYGLPALRTGQLDIVSEINQNETKIDAVKAKTDALPANPALQSDVAAVGAAVAQRPLIGDIQNRLDLMRDNIKGVDNRSITDVYDHFDISSVAKTSDPRFAYLDAAVSSRSTLTASQVWAYSTRTLTNFVLDATNIAAIWSIPTSQLVTANSIGRRLTDNIDAPISSRATAVQVANGLAGVAQESTVSALQGQVMTYHADEVTRINTANAKLDAIRSKTDNLPSSPAATSTVTNGDAVTQLQLANLALVVAAIQAKTNPLPPDPAKETSVQQRPTNPLRETDARLDNLDAKVSTRSTLNTSNLTPLAKEANATGNANTILAAISALNSASSALNAAVALVKAKTDNLPVDPASNSRIAAAETTIISAIPPASPGGPTAAQIWSYPTRTTTDPVPDLSNIATKTDVAANTFYSNRMSIVFNQNTTTQSVIVWAEKNGQRVVGTDCVIEVKDQNGTTIWSDSAPTPNTDGIFKFSEVVAATANMNYYIVIGITVDGLSRVNQQPFITIG